MRYLIFDYFLTVQGTLHKLPHLTPGIPVPVRNMHQYIFPAHYYFSITHNQNILPRPVIYITHHVILLQR
ncbi:MAG TPA: hypothetical protein PLD63_13955, partial [Ignavibacteria bacterium]|nr:hypothetical protein [Ignavibacteria bacterium]